MLQALREGALKAAARISGDGGDGMVRAGWTPHGGGYGGGLEGGEGGKGPGGGMHGWGVYPGTAVPRLRKSTRHSE